MPQTALVAVENTAFHFDKPFSYALTVQQALTLSPGCRVLVPFGAGNKKRVGVVLALENVPQTQKLKRITAVLDEAPLLNFELLSLARFLRERTFCTYYEACRVMLPPGINQKVVSSYAAKPPEDPAVLEALSPDLRQVYDYLEGKNGYVKRSTIGNALGLRAANNALETLLKQGLLYVNTDAVQGVQDVTVRMVRLCESTDTQALPKLTKKQQEVLQVLQDVGCASVAEVCSFTGYTPSVIGALAKKGLVEQFDQVRLRDVDSPFQAQQTQGALTAQQQTAFDGILHQYNTEGGTALLYGVTGSGKTQVYLHLIDEMQKQGRGVIVMVPEIGLTPQVFSLFRARYGDTVAVFHSALSMGERADEYKRVKSGKATIVVGTRSAVFAPLENIGLLILDEEQEASYQSQSAPRYSTREVAQFRAKWHKGLVLLASATPSVETYFAAQNGRYRLYTLTERYGNALLPRVKTVDLKEEEQNRQLPVLSGTLRAALADTLQKKEQAILLINRRGFHTFAVCRACSHVVRCPHCSISLTYHATNHRLLCHYCGYTRAFSETCDECRQPAVRYCGYGTQRVESMLENEFPGARILRMDVDTTYGRHAHAKKLEQFRKKEYDILLGTQMVAKGLDFPNVTLAGVISVDQQLYQDDFRSLERTFSLLTQLIGRSGRGDTHGLAVIQTVTPENPIILLAAAQDYDAFYNTEIAIRRTMVYPPYCDLCVLCFSGEEERRTKAAADAALALLTQLSGEEYPQEKLIVLGPMPARIAKINNKYRFRLIIKCKFTRATREMFAQLLTQLGKKSEFAAVQITADSNPKDSV